MNFFPIFLTLDAATANQNDQHNYNMRRLRPALTVRTDNKNFLTRVF